MIPIIILVTIPIFFAIVTVSPFDQVEEFNDEIIVEEPEFNEEVSSEQGVNVLYFLLIVIWTIILMRILLQIKKGTFKATKRY
jgi:uncharacterized membrane protein YccF (DUF307 family)